jgi:hypothetical protein
MSTERSPHQAFIDLQRREVDFGPGLIRSLCFPSGLLRLRQVCIRMSEQF